MMPPWERARLTNLTETEQTAEVKKTIATGVQCGAVRCVWCGVTRGFLPRSTIGLSYYLWQCFLLCCCVVVMFAFDTKMFFVHHLASSFRPLPVCAAFSTLGTTAPKAASTFSPFSRARSLSLSLSIYLSHSLSTSPLPNPRALTTLVSLC